MDRSLYCKQTDFYAVHLPAETDTDLMADVTCLNEESN